MSFEKKLSPLAKAIGITVVAGLTAMPVANAASNPFALSDLSAGYKVAEEGKCGGMKSGKEGKCGGDKKSKAEGKCGGDKKSGKEGKCGGDKKTKKDGSCGEGKCGGKK